MKKIIYLILFSILFIPFSVFAETYTLKDLSIDMDDSSWFIFTRDNIKDNPMLEQFEVTYDYMNNFMNTKDIYMDAVKVNSPDKSDILELFVGIKKVDDINNLHTYSTKEINELGEALKERFNADNYDIYSTDKYKYVHVKYYDSTASVNIDEYYTVMNGYGYSILVQKINDFTSSEEKSTQDIIDKITFKYNEEYEKSITSGVLKSALIGAVIGGIVGVLVLIFNRNKKSKTQSV